MRFFFWFYTHRPKSFLPLCTDHMQQHNLYAGFDQQPLHDNEGVLLITFSSLPLGELYCHFLPHTKTFIVPSPPEIDFFW